MNLAAAFVVLQGSQSLSGEFVSRQADLQDLAAEFVIRHAGSQDLAASFEGIVTATPLELKMGFWVRWYSVNLLGNIYIRPMTGSKATDFEVKDNTRGLTVHDADRVMTVTPRRKMRVK